jgi:hypothetical protein
VKSTSHQRSAIISLYGIVRDHLESFLEYARDSYEAPLPRCVEHDLRGYLRRAWAAYSHKH